MWEEKLARYDELVAKCPGFERKGKTMPYTSANGHMFSLLNKDGELGFRFSKQEHMFEDLDKLSEYLNESYEYVMTLKPK